MSKTTIFIDESGKPEVYSSKGTNLVKMGTASKHLILAAIRTNDHLALLQEVTDFKISLLKDPSLSSLFTPSYTLDSFHAQIDHLEIKNRFYTFINSLDIKIDVVVVDKLKCSPFLQENPHSMYSVMAGLLLKYITHKSEEVEIIFSRQDSKLRIKKLLQSEVDRNRLEFLNKYPDLNKDVQLTYKHNPHYTHAGLQVADYVAYAVFQVFEHSKIDYYDLIKNEIGVVRDICNRKYFARSNPLQLSN